MHLSFQSDCSNIDEEWDVIGIGIKIYGIPIVIGIVWSQFLGWILMKKHTMEYLEKFYNIQNREIHQLPVKSLKIKLYA